MGPINWLAVAIAAFAAMCVAFLWHGPLFGRAKQGEVVQAGLSGRRSPTVMMAVTVGFLLLTSAMMGHMFARVGPATLDAKPWLYFMMSGGLALCFVMPALLLSYLWQELSIRLAAIEAGYWLAAYLAMGAVFWSLS